VERDAIDRRVRLQIFSAGFAAHVLWITYLTASYTYSVTERAPSRIKAKPPRSTGCWREFYRRSCTKAYQAPLGGASNDCIETVRRRRQRRAESGQGLPSRWLMGDYLRVF
jgi:hypothetical protein